MQLGSLAVVMPQEPGIAEVLPLEYLSPDGQPRDTTCTNRRSRVRGNEDSSNGLRALGAAGRRVDDESHQPSDLGLSAGRYIQWVLGQHIPRSGLRFHLVENEESICPSEPPSP